MNRTPLTDEQVEAEVKKIFPSAYAAWNHRTGWVIYGNYSPLCVRVKTANEAWRATLDSIQELSNQPEVWGVQP